MPQRTTVVAKVVVPAPPAPRPVVAPDYVATAVPAPVFAPPPVLAVPAPVAPAPVIVPSPVIKNAAPISPPPAAPPVATEAAPAPALPAPPAVDPADRPYGTFLQTIESNQESDARAIREMLEHRQANLALIRKMQGADAAAVAAFEKLVHQFQGMPARSASVPATVARPASLAVAPPVVPALPTTPLPAVAPAAPSPKEIRALMEELDRLSQKVNQLSNMPPVSPNE